VETKGRGVRDGVSDGFAEADGDRDGFAETDELEDGTNDLDPEGVGAGVGGGVPPGVCAADGAPDLELLPDGAPDLELLPDGTPERDEDSVFEEVPEGHTRHGNIEGAADGGGGGRIGVLVAVSVKLPEAGALERTKGFEVGVCDLVTWGGGA